MEGVQAKMLTKIIAAAGAFLLAIGGVECLASEETDYEALYLAAVDLSDGEDIGALAEPAQVLHVAAMFDAEVQNGGAVQFFVNEGTEYAQRVSSSLRALDLEPIAALYENMLAENEIDPLNLSDFECESVEDFAALYERYPKMDEFDAAYTDLREELDFEQKMLDYAEKHLETLQ